MTLRKGKATFAPQPLLHRATLSNRRRLACGPAADMTLLTALGGCCRGSGGAAAVGAGRGPHRSPPFTACPSPPGVKKIRSAPDRLQGPEQARSRDVSSCSSLVTNFILAGVASGTFALLLQLDGPSSDIVNRVIACSLCNQRGGSVQEEPTYSENSLTSRLWRRLGMPPLLMTHAH